MCIIISIIVIIIIVYCRLFLGHPVLYCITLLIVKGLFVEIYFTVLLYCWRAVCGGWLEEKTMGWQPAKSQLCKVIIGQRYRK